MWVLLERFCSISETRAESYVTDTESLRSYNQCQSLYQDTPEQKFRSEYPKNFFCASPISFLSNLVSKRASGPHCSSATSTVQRYWKTWQLASATKHCLYTRQNRKSANPGRWARLNSSEMASRSSTLFLLGANILIPFAILIFASGFFPYKPCLSGLAQYEALDYGPPPEAPFDKVVFMVVDALRRYTAEEDFENILIGVVTLCIP